MHQASPSSSSALSETRRFAWKRSFSIDGAQPSVRKFVPSSLAPLRHRRHHWTRSSVGAQPVDTVTVAVVRDRAESPRIRRGPMKFRVLSFTLAAALAGSLSLPTPAHAAGATCVNDIDCKANGITCGTDICDYNLGATCGPAGASPKGMDGWCDPANGDNDCKCKSLGAKCTPGGVYCTCTTPQECGAGDAGGGSGAATSGKATSGSSGSATSGSSGAATSGLATSGAGTSGSATTTSGSASGSATSGTTTGGTAAGGGSSGGCSVRAVGSSSPWAAAALALGACFAAARRRRK